MINSYPTDVLVRKPKTLLKKKINPFPQLSKFCYLFKHQNQQTTSTSNIGEVHSPRKLLLMDIFGFRKINSIVRNDQFLCLKLNSTKNEMTSFQTHLKRFEACNVQAYKDFGKFLEQFDQQIKRKISRYSRTLLSEGQEFFQKQLQETLSQNSNKNVVCFYYGPSLNLFNFTEIMISNKLLTLLGYDSRGICDDFLKFKHIFLQIFETSLFNEIIIGLGQKPQSFLASLSQIEDKRRENNEESKKLDGESRRENNEELKKLGQSLEIEFQDYIYRVVKRDNILYEQKLKAKFKFSKPNSNTALVELVQMDQSWIVSCEQMKVSQLKEQMTGKEQARIQTQLEFMKMLMHSTLISEPRDKPKHPTEPIDQQLNFNNRTGISLFDHIRIIKNARQTNESYS